MTDLPLYWVPTQFFTLIVNSGAPAAFKVDCRPSAGFPGNMSRHRNNKVINFDDKIVLGE